MNLWVKRIGQLAISAVALFFFSCQEETNFLGYKNPSSKYELSFIDIPIKSSTLLVDSIRTTNFFATNDVNRLLVGHYNDPVFGAITASAYTQFVPDGSLRVYSESTITDTTEYKLVVDSVKLFLQLDYYGYGAYDQTTQKINILEIKDPLQHYNETNVPSTVGGQQKPTTTNYFQERDYYTTSAADVIPTPLGTKTFSVDMTKYNVSNKRDYVYVRLSDEFANRLLNTAKTPDSTSNYRKFTRKFAGLVIAPDLAQSDKIVGINPSDDSTIVRLYYHSINIKNNNKVKDTLILNFNLARATDFISYNKIEVDRSGSALNGLTEFYEEDDTDDKRYIQAGTGVVTKIDFSAFIDSLKDIPRLAINSAELIIDNIDDPGKYIVPQNLIVKLVQENNRFKKFGFPGRTTTYSKDLKVLQLYNGYINFDNQSKYSGRNIPVDSTLNVVNDFGGALLFTYSSSAKQYKAPATMFFNKLYTLSLDEDNTLITKALLIPHVAGSVTSYGSYINGKSLNRVSFDKDNIRLRIYYTIPTVNQNQ